MSYSRLRKEILSRDITAIQTRAKGVSYDPGVLEECLPNLQLVGRNGMHKYNNQDHSMMTALCAAKNIMGAKYDLWAINSKRDYYEEKPVHKERPLPERAAGRPANGEAVRTPTPRSRIGPR